LLKKLMIIPALIFIIFGDSNTKLAKTPESLNWSREIHEKVRFIYNYSTNFTLNKILIPEKI